MSVDVRSTFEALEPLDLKKCNTVGELVRAMSKCSFVARMIGEVTETLHQWIRKLKGDEIPIYPNFPSDLRWLFEDSIQSSGKWRVMRWPELRFDTPLLIVGRFGEEREDGLFQCSPENTIFINREGLCIPGEVQDGYFPNVVFEDPRFVLPVISAALDEWLGFKTWTVTELFKTLSLYGGVAAEVVEGARVLKTMIDDPECTVFMTASGAMTIAQLDYLFCDMIEGGMIQYLATTGALMAHGLVKNAGCRQFKHRPEHGDELYAKQKINRVTDTLDPEENFDQVDEVMNVVLERLSQSCGTIGPSLLHREIGRYLADQFPHEQGILKLAYENHIHVCETAFVALALAYDEI